MSSACGAGEDGAPADAESARAGAAEGETEAAAREVVVAVGVRAIGVRTVGVSCCWSVMISIRNRKYSWTTKYCSVQVVGSQCPLSVAARKEVWMLSVSVPAEGVGCVG